MHSVPENDPCAKILTDGLAVDWINDKLYFTFAGTSSNTYHMAIYNITTGGDYEIILTSNVRYYEIAVDPVAQ